jgi:hypothetical protein
MRDWGERWPPFGSLSISFIPDLSEPSTSRPAIRGVLRILNTFRSIEPNARLSTPLHPSVINVVLLVPLNECGLG